MQTAGSRANPCHLIRHSTLHRDAANSLAFADKSPMATFDLSEMKSPCQLGPACSLHVQPPASMVVRRCSQSISGRQRTANNHSSEIPMPTACSQYMQHVQPLDCIVIQKCRQLLALCGWLPMASLSLRFTIMALVKARVDSSQQ